MAVDWSYTLNAPSGGQLPGVGKDFSGNASGIVYRQLALDPATGDLVKPLRWLIGAPAVVQRMRVRARLWLGEWFLDKRIGVPYREVVLVHSPDIPFINAMFREVFVSTPGVKSVTRFNADFQRKERRFIVNDMEAQLVDGATVIMTDEPFIFAKSLEPVP